MSDKSWISDQQQVAAAQNVKERDYWLSRLSGEWELVSFPADVADTGAESTGKASAAVELRDPLFSQLVKLGSGHDHTLHMIAAAAVTLLLYKYTDSSDIIIGAPIYRQEIEGEFINTVLALRSFLTPALTFKELLIQVRQSILEANQHQNYPFETLLYHLGVSYHPGDQFPLFDVVVLMESLHDKRYIQHIPVNTVFCLRRFTHHLEVELEYNPRQYKKNTAQRLLLHLVNILEKVLSNLEVSISRLSVLNGDEQQKILYDFNHTSFHYQEEKTLHRLFQEQVLRKPDYTAVICKESRVTYRELNERANRLAWVLRSRGVGVGSFMAVVMDRSVEMVAAVMGILKAGAAYVPMEPDLPGARIRKILAAIRIKGLITNHARLQEIAAAEPPGDLTFIVCMDGGAGIGFLSKGKELVPAAEIEKQPGENLDTAVMSRDTAYVIHTSGTTGVPKGVMEQHRPVVNVVEWVNRTCQVDTKDKLLFVASLGFDLSVYDIFGILATGASIVVVSQESIAEPHCLLDFLFREGITIWDSAPAALQQLAPFFPEVRKKNIKSCLRWAFLSGDWIPVTLPDHLRETFRGVRVMAMGGATEATIWSNYFLVGQVDPGWPSIPYGKPLQNARYYILDHQLRPCPIGVAGELFISGQCLAVGYINDVELTAHKFKDNPFVKGEKIYLTGDRARWFEDGNMEFLGRRDSQVKIRGHRIELGEIETQLLKHPDIETAIIIVREPGAGKGGRASGDQYLCAYYISNQELDAHLLKDFLARELPGYMIPLYFVKIDRIPLTVSGKVDRRALPEPEKKSGQLGVVPPRNKVDKILIGIWSELLNIPEVDISICLNFFESGGHSLNAAELVSQIHRQFNVRIPLIEVFAFPTIREMSDYISRAEPLQFCSIEPVETREFNRQSSAQVRLYLTQEKDKTNKAYNMPLVLRLEGDLDLDRLAESFRRLIRRHESLRTSFGIIDGGLIQWVHDKVEFEIEYYKVHELNEKNNKNFHGLLDSFIRPFNLSCAPLVRVGVVQLGGNEEGRHLLMIDMHHLISDGISLAIVRQESLKLYVGEELPSLKLQYRDFSGWQSSEIAQAAIKNQKAYWMEMFQGPLPVIDIPTDYKRPVLPDFEGRVLKFEIGARETRALNSLVLKKETSLFMVLLAIYNVLLSKLSGKEDIIVGTGTAGRRHVDLANIVGLFMNTLALRNFPKGDLSFTEFLADLKRNTLNAFENQDYTYDQLVQDLKAGSMPVRDISRNPFFDTMFALENYERYSAETEVMQLPGLRVIPCELEYTTAKFDLFFIAYEKDNGITIFLEYAVSLFKQSTVEWIRDAYREIVNQVVEDNEIRLKDIRISPCRVGLDVKSRFSDQDYKNFNF